MWVREWRRVPEWDWFYFGNLNGLVFLLGFLGFDELQFHIGK
jgi:hypothetical protein